MNQHITRFMDSEELYTACETGKRKGWEEASNYIFRYLSWKQFNLSKEAKEDLTQQTLFYALIKIRERDIREPKAFKRLLRGKAGWLVIDYYRKHKDTIELPGPGQNDNDTYGGHEPPSRLPDPELMYFRKQVTMIFSRVIKSMRERCKKYYSILFSSDSISKDLEEVAKNQNRPLSTVKTEYYRCRNAFFNHPLITNLLPEVLRE